MIAGAATPYASHAERYSAGGWLGVLPLPPRKKASPPDNYTGDTGSYPTPTQISEWVQAKATGNIGLRMNENVIGIDVDNYGNKPGAQTFADLTSKLGPLPDTWTSTSRTDGVSGIRFYRIPQPTKLIGNLPGIEFIQRHHRYAVVAPSIHPDTGESYRWIGPGGEIGDITPNINDLPMLPEAWLQHLEKKNKTTRQRHALSTGVDVAEAVDKAYGAAVRGLHQGTRHDSALAGATTLIRLEALDYPGATTTLTQLRLDFLSAVGDSRDGYEAEAEWGRIVTSAQELVSSSPSIAPRWAEWRRAGAPDPDRDPRSLIGDTPSSTASTNPPTTGQDWPEPIPLGSVTTLPPFPIHVLPAWIADYATEVADDIQVPVDLPATLAIGALSTLAAGHVIVQVAGRWTEHTNLFLVVAMPPSTGKSPSYKAMCSPVLDLEREYRLQMRANVSANADLVDAIEGELKRAKQLMDINTAALAEIRGRLHEAQDEQTTLPKLTIGDATPEALEVLLAQNGGRMAVHSTEGGVFSMMTGRYSESSNLDVYLQGWSGDRLDSSRISREANQADEAILTMVLTVQPKVISDLAERPELAGRGLTARFMYSMPPDVLGHRDLSLRHGVQASHRDAYSDQLRTLGRQFLSWKMPATIRLNQAAAEHYTDWRQRLERRRTVTGDLRPLAEWTGKLESSVLRLSALLHFASGHDYNDDVTLTTMTQALSVGDYWLAHAGHVHDLWGTSPEITSARKVTAWADTLKRSTFTVRDLYASNRATFKKADETLPALTLLTERGWIRTADGGPVATQRNKRSVVFEVHPQLSTVSARSARVVLRGEKQALSLFSEIQADEGARQHDAQNAQNSDVESSDDDPLAGTVWAQPTTNEDAP